jgi:hypothetical protein
MIKQVLKKLSALLPVEYFERVSVYSMYKHKFYQTMQIPSFEDRFKLYDFTLEEYFLNSSMTYIEFGVWKGESLNYFLTNNLNNESIFIGLDSFEGLPEAWAGMPKGTFNTNGQLPDINDARVKFIKGWFQETWPQVEQLVYNKIDNPLFVHFDADLYSSTLFALTKMDIFRRPYYAIFDEFFGDETRALYQYLKAYDADVEFIAKTDCHISKGYPKQLLCKITPKG